MSRFQTETLEPIEMVHVGALRPVEVLYEFDCEPLIFVARLPASGMVLAYLADEYDPDDDPGSSGASWGPLRYLVSTTSLRTIERLKLGRISVHEAMMGGSMWLVDIGFDLVPLRAYAVEPSMLPEDALPEPDVMLWAELQPDLIVKLEGAALDDGAWPAAALASAGEIASKALKPLYDWAIALLTGESIQGRPPDWHRLAYGLSAQRVVHGSLELHLVRQRPEASAQGDMFEDDETAARLEAIHAQVWDAMREGLEWATDSARDNAPSPDDAKALAVLDTLKRLAPNSTGPVETVRVSGALVSDGSEAAYRLDRNAAQRVREALVKTKKRSSLVQQRVFEGQVRELDLDALTLIVRDPRAPNQGVPMVLEDGGMLDMAHDAHYHGAYVSIAARREGERGAWVVFALEFIDAPQPPNTISTLASSPPTGGGA